MECYVKNPSYEFIEDEKSIVLFDADMKVIYNVDTIGKEILKLFDEPIELHLLQKRLETVFTNINDHELLEFVEWLKQNKIIVQIQK